MKYKLYLTSLCAIFLLGGCFSKEIDIPFVKPAETAVNITMVPSGITTPLAVHFFALENDEQFKKLDYFELLKRKQTKLNGDIISQSKKIITPGKTLTYHSKLSPNVHYYAVVVGFENVADNDNWRYIQEIIPSNDNTITLQLTEDKINKIAN